MARYEPKHLQKRKRIIFKKRTRKERTRKSSFIIVGTAFIVFVIFSTLYSVFVYPTTLPQVTVMAPEKMIMSSTGTTFNYSIPKECVFYEKGTNEFYCYVVQKQDGGFGPKYYVVRNVIKTQKHYFKEEETNVPFASSEIIHLPYVRSTSEPLYNYCEVNIINK